MSLVRSIDKTDLGGGTVTTPVTGEGVILIGPQLQTPKDTSIIVLLCSINYLPGTGATQVALNVRKGTTVSGQQIGSGSGQQVTGLTSVTQTFAVATPSNFTDYAQYCLTFSQQSASAAATIWNAIIVALSF